MVDRLGRLLIKTRAPPILDPTVRYSNTYREHELSRTPSAGFDSSRTS